MKNIIKPTVKQNGTGRMEVPILYGDSERWNQIQKLGYIRDGNEKPMLPLILFKRTNLTKERFTSKIDANNPHNIRLFTKAYNQKNAYSNFDTLNRNFPEKQYYVSVMPDYVTLDYDVIISTYFAWPLNKAAKNFGNADCNKSDCSATSANISIASTSENLKSVPLFISFAT
mgnify:CR=1 FL=1